MTQMPNDPFDTEEWRSYAQHALEELVPKMEESGFVIQLVPRKPEHQADIKFCLELGVSIMLDKPIVAVIRPGTPVPERLRRAADVLVEIDDIRDPASQLRLMDAIKSVTGLDFKESQ